MMKRPLNAYLTSGILLCLFFSACRHEIPSAPKPEEKPITAQTCSPDTVYFVRDILPILQGNCAISGCHNSTSRKDGVDLSSYERVMSTADIRPFEPGESDLYEVINETRNDKRMPPPPAPPLTTEQKNKIEKWIAQGARNNDCKSCDSTQVGYTATILPLIQASCLGCHQQANPSGGVALDTYSTIKAQALSGALFGSISGNGYVQMPYMQNPLSACDQAKIKNWIAQGAPQN